MEASAFQKIVAQCSLSLSAFSSGFAQESSQPTSESSKLSIVARAGLNDASIGGNREVGTAEQAAERGESLRVMEAELAAKSAAAGQGDFSLKLFNKEVHRITQTVLGETVYLFRFSPRERASEADTVSGGQIKNSSLVASENGREALEGRLKERGFIITEVAEDANGPQASLEKELQLLAQRVEQQLTLRGLEREYRGRLSYLLAAALTTALVVVGIAALRIATKLRLSKQDRLIAKGSKSTDQAVGEPSKNAELKHSINVGAAPFVTITLQAGESVVGQSGSFLYAGSVVKRELVTGQSQGFSRTPVGLLTRLLIGESWRFLKYTNTSNEPQELGLASSQIGTLVHVNLRDFPDGLYADGGAFFACGPGATLAMERRAGVMGGLSGIGLFQQKFKGDGDAFLFARGELKQLDITEGETMLVDSGALFMWEPTVVVTLEYLGFWAALTGGEGLFLCKLTGHGRVHLATRGSEDDTSSNRSTGLEKLLDPILRLFN
jgi:uncharacterized protein (AIM24 family)